MARNIVIFADGTGQRGGVLFDECRSNIYKLYRATRTAPDSGIDPAEQLAFYDPGIGTLPKGIGLLGGVGQWLYNLVCQATGLGLTENIIDGYTHIIRHWHPGDRIFLIGFSRGAYTVRCIAAVLTHCGVPTRMKDGTPLKRDEASCRRIAVEAVTRVYQHVSSDKDRRYLGQRKALASRFRVRHASGEGGVPNATLHFIGVFDTVAALSNKGSLLVTAVIGMALLVGLAWGVSLLTLLSERLGWSAHYGFWDVAGPTTVFVALAIGAAYLRSHVKLAIGLPRYPWWKTLHLTSFRMKFYDQKLSTRVGWARHALAIDEARADFDRVPWGDQKLFRVPGPGEPEWLKQLWFAGCHSDVGGSYPDSESRLSDISLGWMVEEATAIPGPLLVDETVLRLYPDPLAMQHDETRGFAFRFAGRKIRDVPNDAVLHPSVLKRLEAPEVLQYDLSLPYRPQALRRHNHHRQAAANAASTKGEAAA